MAFELPQMLKTAERLNAEVEEAVRRFSRRDKYSFGNELRAAVRQAWRLANESYFNKDSRDAIRAPLVRAVDDVKFNLRLGWRISAFRSKGEFEQLCRSAAELGRQVGGWTGKKEHLKRQNPPAQKDSDQAERPQILSSHAASPEARV